MLHSQVEDNQEGIEEINRELNKNCPSFDPQINPPNRTQVMEYFYESDFYDASSNNEVRMTSAYIFHD